MNIVNDVGADELAYWVDREGAAQLGCFTTPDEQAVGIEPAYGFVTPANDPADLGMQVVRVAWKPDEIDLVHLARGGTIWLSCWGGLPVHNLHVQPPPDPLRSER